MWHRSRLTDAIEIRAGEASRTIGPGQRVDLAAEILPGVPLAQVVKLEWFEPEAVAETGAEAGRRLGALAKAPWGVVGPAGDIETVASAGVGPDADPAE